MTTIAALFNPVFEADVQESLEHLIAVALRDTHQSSYIANFLLSWWNSPVCGGFDLTDLWGVDDELCAHVLLVFGFAAARRAYPDALGYKAQFDRIVALHRPHLVSTRRGSLPPLVV
jgi:hypothetical protein